MKDTKVLHGTNKDVKIFINHRRIDTGWVAKHLYDRLEDIDTGALRLIPVMDIDKLLPGVDFVQWIDSEVSQSDVMLVLIGKDWLKIIAQRKDELEDWVRLEIEAALKRGVYIIPILVDGVAMPKEADLPESIKGLVTRHAHLIDRLRVERDVDTLLVKIPEAIEGRRDTRGREILKSKGVTYWFQSLTVDVVGNEGFSAEALAIMSSGVSVFIAPSILTAHFSWWVIKGSVYELLVGSILILLALALFFLVNVPRTGTELARYMIVGSVPLIYIATGVLCLIDASFFTAIQYVWNGIIGSIAIIGLYATLIFLRYQDRRRSNTTTLNTKENNTFVVALMIPIVFLILSVVSMVFHWIKGFF